MTGSLDGLSPLKRYTRASERASAEIIGAYSTSFGTATRLLGPRHRSHVRNIYALVRIADELVDGVAAEATLTPSAQRTALDQLEADTERAIKTGYSTNPIIHAFAYTARQASIDEALTRPFFSSMRTDLAAEVTAAKSTAPRTPSLYFDDAEHADYVYGSAEVVGLMCLQVFIREQSPSRDDLATLVHGARRLGAAFQNINFLRDLGDDTARLGRSYLSDDGRLDDALKDRWVDEIRSQLSDAQAALPLLPRDARVAVDSALRLFARLADRISRAPAEDLHRRRVRVPNVEKSGLVAAAWVAARRGRAR